MDTSDNLVRMANDIGNFFKSEAKREDAIAGISNHILSYWTRPMRTKLLERVAHGEAGLDELPREAMRQIAERKDEAPRQPVGGDAG